KQRSQNTTWSRTAISAAARVRASVSDARSRWNVRRWAVFGPMPGSRANDSISRATGSMSGLATGRGLHPRQAKPAGHRGHLLLREGPCGPKRVVDGRDHEVLEHVDVGRVDHRRVDGDTHELLLAGDCGADDAAARRTVDLRRLELRLDPLHLLLHLLRDPLQVAHPHPVRSSHDDSAVSLP